MSQSLTERYDDRIADILSCYDRVVITGTLPTICYAEGMTRFLHASAIKIFDYAAFAQTLRDRVRDAAASLAAKAGVTIEHIAKNHVRKEAVVQRVLEQRGEHSGLVHIISAMEACDAYRPWHDKSRTRLSSARTAANACTIIPRSG
jgi:enoyl-[acyl-carrier-protein] reductase (NADH)